MTPERLNQIVAELDKIRPESFEELQVLSKITEELRQWARKIDTEGGG